jgi:hypothetical protein
MGEYEAIIQEKRVRTEENLVLTRRKSNEQEQAK